MGMMKNIFIEDCNKAIKAIKEDVSLFYDVIALADSKWITSLDNVINDYDINSSICDIIKESTKDSSLFHSEYHCEIFADILEDITEYIKNILKTECDIDL